MIPTFPMQLCTSVTEAPEGAGWLHEIKFDGYRVHALREGARVRLLTRRRQEWSARYPAVREAVATLPAREACIDGEVVVLDARGISDFAALAAGRGTPTLQAFDLLWLDGEDLRTFPLEGRKERLRRLVEGSAVRFVAHHVGEGPAFFSTACRHGLEGVVSKRRDAPWREGRGPDWRKIKCHARQEFVVVGWTDPAGARDHFGALLLAVREGGALRYVGRVGTGFSEAALARIHTRLRPRASPPVRNPPDARGLHWVEPEHVADVRFAGWTDAGLLRQPAFVALREDKGAREVVVERPITHPERELWPGITRLDLVRYYERVASRMLPHLARRPLTLRRCPDGLGGPCFWQRHHTPSLPGALHPCPDGDEVLVYLEDVDGLYALAQIAVLEVHPWGARVDDLERPDRLVFDLDPGAGVPWGEVAAAARTVRDTLAAGGLRAFVRRTGGKGLHVVVPYAGGDWSAASAFCRELAEGLARAEPERFTARMGAPQRVGKVFVDWLRNLRGSTAVGAWSTRALAGAPVAAPCAWEEIDTEVRFHVGDADAFVAGPDPWEALA